MKSIRLVIPVFAALAAPALAGTVPLRQPQPPWIAAAPALETLARDNPDTGLLLFDQQQRLENGEVWSYIDSANRITSEQTLQQAGTVKLQWQPDNGDLIVHRIAILRDGKRIDLLADAEPFTVLRRERGLEQLSIDGVLTATMPVKGLQVGDVLEVAYSTTHADPVTRGDMQAQALLLTDPARAGFARARLIWKGDKVRWKALSEVKSPRLGMANGYHELVIALPLGKQPDIPADAPLRFRPLPVVEASTFADWAAVAAVMAPLYRTAGTIPPGGPLAAEVARIKAASADPKVRTAMALQSVQSEVRYLFNGLNGGNYVPQTPEKTWSVRYGDCKAKTLLLLAMLDALDVKAEAVMANPQLGDYLPSRLPSAAAFNHVLVRASAGGETFLIDGTSSGARLADLGDTPDFRYVLPIRAAGATLEKVVNRANARATIDIDETIDQSAGVGIPALFSAAITLRSGIAEQLKSAAAQVSADKRNELIDNLVQRMLHPALIVTRDIAYDTAGAAVTIKVTGLASGDWARSDQRYELTLDQTVGKISFDADRARPEWRAIPVRTGGVGSLAWKTTVKLPDGGRGFVLEGDQQLARPIAGSRITRSVVMKDGAVTVADRIDETGAEIAPADIAATKVAVAQARSRLLKAVAPRTYPRRWEVVAAARDAGRLAEIERRYAALIAAAPEKPPAYLSRAAFRRGVYDRKGAVADLDKAIAERPDIDTYLARAALEHDLRQDAKALADAKAARDLDPGSDQPTVALALLQADSGQYDAAIALIDERIAAGGDAKPTMQAIKADFLGRSGKPDAGLALLDTAIVSKPGDAQLVNNRCWLQATLGVHLDTALKDCTRSIEIGGGAAALDSRALVWFKLGKFDAALADLDAALDVRPEQAGSLFLRAAVLARRGGNDPRAIGDLAGARAGSPRIDEEYGRYGVTLAATPSSAKTSRQ